MRILLVNMYTLSLVVMILFMACPGYSHAQDEKQDLVLASRIIDADVYDAGGNLIGEVDDLVIAKRGELQRMTIEFGGLFGLADKLVALSPVVFEIEGGHIVLNITEEQLKRLPEFSYYASGLTPEYYYRTTLYARQYYYYPPPDYYYSESLERAYSPARFLASVILNRKLITKRKTDIGRVNDLLIDRKENTIDRIVVSEVKIEKKDVYVALPYKPMSFIDDGLVYEIDPAGIKGHIFAYEQLEKGQ
jgi:sporulation protein YlmC with PRC-barrel domain